MKVSSPEFEANGFIPEKYTCDGENVNPVLMIDEIPSGAESLVVIVDDPDAARKVWVHWVVYDLPVMNRIEQRNALGKQGMNDFGKPAYGGPCPQSGAHRYRFKVYALDSMLNLDVGASLQKVESAMRHHILGLNILVGMYQSKMERESAGTVR